MMGVSNTPGARRRAETRRYRPGRARSRRNLAMHALLLAPARPPASLSRPLSQPHLQRVRTAEVAVARYLAGLGAAYADKTRRSLTSDWACFARWCAENARAPFPTSPETLIAYLEALSPVHRLSTLRRRLATLSHLHDALGAPNPTREQPVRLALRGIARIKGQRPEGRRAPLRQPDVDAMIAALGGSLRDVRDKALLLTARDSLARRSELARLAVGDIEWRAAGDARALLRRTKGDADGRSVWLAPETCAALRDWLEAAGIAAGPVFRRVHSDGRVGERLLGQAIARRFKRLAAAAGLAATRVSGHSTRIGMCCDLVADGQSLVAVQLAGGWVSPAMPAHYAADLLPELGAVARYHHGRT
jgi:site-specific recombinase XerD